MKFDTSRPLRVTVVTKSGSLAGGANTYEAAVIRVLSELQNDGVIELSVLVPAEVPESEGSVEYPSSHRYPNSTLSKVRSLIASTPLGRLAPARFSLSPLHKSLEALGPDIVYFASPNIHAMGISKHRFIFTVWDLGHRELRQFPEFANPAEYFLRERLYRKAFARAWRVVTDSRWTGHRLEEVYGLAEERWLSLGMAFTVPKITEMKPGVVDGPYFLYPAQRWPHKNHRTLLEGFSRVVKARPEVKLVFIGSPKGSGVNIDSWINEFGITENVIDLGFVDAETSYGLIAGAVAIVMPTFLGPTNLPPLEAASVGVRSIVSDVHHFDEDLKDYLTLVSPDDPNEWGKEMLKSLDAKAVEPWDRQLRTKAELSRLLGAAGP